MFRKFILQLRDLYLVNIKWKNYKIGNNFHAGKNVVIWAKDIVEIGNNCYIGRNSQIETNIKIGNDVLIANSVAIVGRYDHNYQEFGKTIRQSSQIRDSDYNWKAIGEVTIIENDVWIGYGVIILSGITIKTGSIIAAGSVVTKNVKEYEIYGGNPAKKISNRFENNIDLKKHIKLMEEKNENYGL